MNEMSKPAAAIKGEEHWTTKDGGVKLFLFEKSAGDPAKTVGTILFVHGSSMASQPTFDLQVPGRPAFLGHGLLCQPGLRLLDRRHGGLWPLHQGPRQQRADQRRAPTTAMRAALYIQKLRGKRPLLVYGISSGALRAAMFAERHPEMVARLALDAMVWTGEGSPTLAERKKKLPDFIKINRRPMSKAFIHSVFDRDHPDTAERKVIEAFADAVIALDDSVPTGTYVDMCSRLPVIDPEKILVPMLVMRGQHDGIASMQDLLKFFEKLPNPDKQFTVMSGISHASFQQKNYMMVYHILSSFFAQPEPVYKG